MFTTKPKKSISVFAFSVLTILSGGAFAQGAGSETVSIQNNSLNSEKAATTFTDAMDIAGKMQLTGAAAELNELSRKLHKTELEVRLLELEKDRLEAQQGKQMAMQSLQASMMTPISPQGTTDVVNALPSLPANKGNPAGDQTQSDNTDPEKTEDAFEHSPLPMVRLISGTEDKYRAIISKSNGSPATVHVGDKIGTWTVSRIDTSGVEVVGGDKKKTVEHLSFTAD